MKKNTHGGDNLSRAEIHFQASERRDAQFRAELAKERAATDAKTAKLRALRLAKEESDRIAKAAFDAAHPLPAPRPRTRRPKATA